MILKAARELIVEDLNSTNGVLVNGRKVTRHVLNDGDVLTVGEIQFRCVLKLNAPERVRPMSPGERTGGAGRGHEPTGMRHRRCAGAGAAGPDIGGSPFIGAAGIRYLSRPSCALSSAVEHHLDMVGVSGSIPLARTTSSE